MTKLEKKRLEKGLTQKFMADNIDVSIATSNALNINLIGCVEFINNQEYCDLREVVSKIGNSFNVVNS